MKKIKLCIVCGKELTGRQTVLCSDRECHRERKKNCDYNWYQNNQERILKNKREHHHNNREKINKRERERRRKNRKLKFCIVCGGPLPKYKQKLCSDECRREGARRSLHKHRQNNWVPKFCVVCDGLLPKHKQKLCSPECIRKWREKWSWDNREKTNERAREQYHNNPEQHREHYQKNKERIKQRTREYRQNNLEKVKEYLHKYRQNNKEKLKKHRYALYRRVRGLPEDWDLSKESSIETIMKRWLQELDIKFIQQHSINLENSTRTLVDFYIPEVNICLYCDGDYWHGPKKPKTQERDNRINKALESGGQIAIRLSESDILAGVRPIEILELIQ